MRSLFAPVHRGLGRLLTVSALACAIGSAAADRPNLLLIMTDQQTAGALSCAGNPHVKTPNLDELAAHGVRFTKSYVAHPLCVPSRASLFSSRMPHELGIYGNTMDAVLETKGVPTMGELLQSAGYETAYAGKWHVHDAFPAYSKKGGKIPGFAVLPQEGNDPRQGDKKTQEKAPQCDPFAAEAAARFLKQPHEKPFALVVSLLNPHDICEFSSFQGFRDMLPADPAQLPPLRPNARDADKLPSELLGEMTKTGSWTDLQWRQYQWIYYRLVESSDRLIGQVLDALKGSGLDSNTVVVFTSDHGEMLGSHRLVTKQKLYEESVTVPLIVAPPGGAARVDQERLVTGLDVMPTLLDYAGIAAPPSLEGRSLRPLVEGKDVPWRAFVVSETFDPEARMVRTGRYKYIVFARGEDREQFFDLEQDPGEVENLIGRESLAGEAERHRGIVKEQMRATGDVPGRGTQALEAVKKRERAKKQTGDTSGASP